MNLKETDYSGIVLHAETLSHNDFAYPCNYNKISLS